MPEHWLSEAEVVRLTGYPPGVPEVDVVTFFTLTESDYKLLAGLRGDDSRLGFALQLCTLRYLGFVPADLAQVPTPVITFLAWQLAVHPDAIRSYGERSQTRTDHLQEIEHYLGFHKASATERSETKRWLRERALEHDRPLLLLQLLCERLHAQQIVRPGLTLLERSVTTARQQAQTVTWELIAPRLSAEDLTRLDRLLVVEEGIGLTPLTRFRTGATSHSAGAILNALEKIAELRATGLAGHDLSALNPNRLKLLARVGRKATNQALARMTPERRYPILLTFVQQTLTDTIDEAVDLYDRCLAEAYSRAGRELEEFRRRVAKATNEKVRLFQTVGRILLDPDVKDAEIRSLIYQQIAPEDLRSAVEECEQIMRPPDDSYFDLLAPRFLDIFTWRAAQEDDALLRAVAVTASRHLSNISVTVGPLGPSHRPLTARLMPRLATCRTRFGDSAGPRQTMGTSGRPRDPAEALNRRRALTTTALFTSVSLLVEGHHVGRTPTHCYDALGTVVLGAAHRFPSLTASSALIARRQVSAGTGMALAML